jgi:Protein phosphatase 2C
VQVRMATSAGHPGWPNEDFVGAVPGAVVLLDGAGIPGTESICGHGVAWYTHRLGGALLGRLSRDDGQDLAACLAIAIEEIAADHRSTCDISNPSSPQATVAVIRAAADQLDYLLLADCFVVLDRVSGEPLVITDEREVNARRICSAPLAGLASGTPEYERAWDSCIEALQARRNQPGGYWIAKDDPRAAEEAVTGSRPLEDLDSIALLSNGASRIVNPYGLSDWPGLIKLLRATGPAEVIRRVRHAESGGSEGPNALVPDDSTVAHCTWLPRAAAAMMGSSSEGSAILVNELGESIQKA